MEPAVVEGLVEVRGHVTGALLTKMRGADAEGDHASQDQSGHRAVDDLHPLPTVGP